MFPQAIADISSQTNVLIDRDFRPRLTDYGLIPIGSDPDAVDPGSTTSPSVSAARHMTQELVDPSGFGLKNSIPTKKGDIYALGVVMYQVRNTHFTSGMVAKGNT
ncbi:hypothetical protein BDM02DRAFT_3115609 [Thelephora ganbajun]|uniref:Uncharacterized protein n=1 Tax=Thelephora ganbajun TaxID=370292 RepID=A0ACB6ZG44_THEGA|nr:hypothetical protein BDM02DRAFT_3115609 [Thelephora ganbajun]